MMSAPAITTANGGSDAARPWRTRLARLLLLAGVAFALVRVLPSVPHEQILLFRFDGIGAVSRLSATWTVPGRSEPEGGVTLHFPASSSRTVRHAISLPNGPYVLDISVERNEDKTSPAPPRPLPDTRDSVAAEGHSEVGTHLPDELSQTRFIRRVNLAGGETVIRL
jgi:hypothetical protein